jgi:hypothetical protein
MPRKRGRIRIPGNRWEAAISASRELADIMDLKREGDSLRVIRKGDFPHLRTALDRLTFLKEVVEETVKEEVGPFVVVASPSKNEIRHWRGGGALHDLADEDIRELGELAGVTEDTMEDPTWV